MRYNIIKARKARVGMVRKVSADGKLSPDEGDAKIPRGAMSASAAALFSDIISIFYAANSCIIWRYFLCQKLLREFAS